MQKDRPRVLLVDDELGTIEVIGAVLEHQGLTVTLARSTRDAIRMLKITPFEAVVTDVVFEGSYEGGEVLAACRELRPEAAVLLMTGYPAVDGAVSAIKNGAIDYLQKPVDPVVLAAMVHRALRERAMDSENLGFVEAPSSLQERSKSRHRSQITGISEAHVPGFGFVKPSLADQK